MLISPSQAEALAESWLAAWNAHDIEMIMAHYAENVEFESPFVTALLNKANGKINGKAELEAYFLRGLANYPTLHFQLLYVLSGVASVTLVYKSVNHLLAAEVMEIDSGGQVFRVMAHYRPFD